MDKKRVTGLSGMHEERSEEQRTLPPAHGVLDGGP